MTCTLDFLGYDAATNEVTFGPDGSLVVEFHQMVTFAQQAIETNSLDSFACAVRNAGYLSCLDIAAPSTLSGSIDTSAFNNGVNHLLASSDVILDMFASANGTSAHLWGQQDACDAAKVTGDGVVNVFDVGILMAYIFQEFGYADLSRDASTIVTVAGRDDVRELCGRGVERLTHLQRYAENTCVDFANVTAFSGRRLSAASDAMATFLALPAPEPLGYTVGPRRDDPLERIQSVPYKLQEQSYAFVRDYEDADGARYTLSLPAVSTALEVKFSAPFVATAPVALDNAFVSMRPPDVSVPVVGFTRHCEFGRNCRHACAAITGGFEANTALMRDTLSLMQRPYIRSCAFDVHLWVPSTFGAPVCVEYLVAANGDAGVYNGTQVCGRALSSDDVGDAVDDGGATQAEGPSAPSRSMRSALWTMLGMALVLCMACVLARASSARP